MFEFVPSEAVTEKLKIPLTVGVPLIETTVPFVANVIPLGSAPPVIE
jgi:hypothetical protein